MMHSDEYGNATPIPSRVRMLAYLTPWAIGGLLLVWLVRL